MASHIQSARATFSFCFFIFQVLILWSSISYFIWICSIPRSPRYTITSIHLLLPQPDAPTTESVVPDPTTETDRWRVEKETYETNHISFGGKKAPPRNIEIFCPSQGQNDVLTLTRSKNIRCPPRTPTPSFGGDLNSISTNDDPRGRTIPLRGYSRQQELRQHLRASMPPPSDTNSSLVLQLEISNPNEGMSIFGDDIHVMLRQNDSIIGDQTLRRGFYLGYKGNITLDVPVNVGKVWGSFDMKIRISLMSWVKFKYRIFRIVTKNHLIEMETYVNVALLDGRKMENLRIKLRNKKGEI